MYILFLFTVITSSTAYQRIDQAHDWRALSEFNSRENCEKAIKELGIKLDRARCLPK